MQENGRDSAMEPSAELDQNIPDGVVAEKAFVERLETDADHGEEVLDEDDTFLASAAPEVWEYDVVDARSSEFEEAIRGSDLVIEYDVVDTTVTDSEEVVSPLPSDETVYPLDNLAEEKADGGSGGIDDLTIVKANDPHLGLTNRGEKPALDWAADTGPTRNPDPNVKIETPPRDLTEPVQGLRKKGR